MKPLTAYVLGLRSSQLLYRMTVLEFRFYVRCLPQNLKDRMVYEFLEAKAKGFIQQ